MMREQFEYLTEYDWNMAHKSPQQRRCGVIALAIFGFMLVGALVLAKSF